MGCSGSTKSNSNRQPSNVQKKNQQAQRQKMGNQPTGPSPELIANGAWSQNRYANNKGLYVQTGVDPNQQQYVKQGTGGAGKVNYANPSNVSNMPAKGLLRPVDKDNPNQKDANAKDEFIVPNHDMVVPTSYVNLPYDYKGNSDSDAESVSILILNISKFGFRQVIQVIVCLTQKLPIVTILEKMLLILAVNKVILHRFLTLINQ